MIFNRNSENGQIVTTLINHRYILHMTLAQKENGSNLYITFVNGEIIEFVSDVNGKNEQLAQGLADAIDKTNNCEDFQFIDAEDGMIS